MTQAPLQLRRADAPSQPSGLLLRVRTLLPLYWWRGVPVMRDVRPELTIFERYLLEMALALGSLSSADVEEVLDLPPEFLNRGAWRLTAADALRRDGDVYHAVADTARQMLDTRTLPRLVESTADFVLLPRTGDLLALVPGRGGWLAEADRQRRKLRPRRTAPVPAGLWPRRRAEYLAERVGAAEVSGPDRDIARVLVPESGDEPLLPPLPLAATPATPGEGEGDGETAAPSGVPRGCPAYYCSAEVRQDASGVRVEAELSAEPPGLGPDRDSAEDGAGDDVEEDQDEAGSEPRRRAREDRFTLTADLTGADALVASWRGQLDALDTEPNLRAAWRHTVTANCDFLRAERTNVSAWVFYLDGDAAETIALSGQSLVDPAGLEIEGEEAILEVHLGLAPADDVAHAWFARDLAIASLVAEADPATRIGPVFSAALAELEGRGAHPSPPARTLFTETAVRERIWQLRRFRLAYALREHRDFSYGDFRYE